MKIAKLVIIEIILTALIPLWPIVPIAIFKRPDFTSEPWWIVSWIVFWILPFIYPFMFMKKVFGWGKGMKRMLKDGRPAEAVILELNESSLGGTVTVNDQPYVNLKLEVHDGSNPPYVASIDTVISRLAIPQFQPGTRIPIKIDPNDPNNIVIDSQREPGKPVYGNIEDGETVESFASRGKKGTAKIISIEDTGKSKNYQPIIKMILEVSGPEIKKYSFEKEVPIPTQVVGILKVGSVIPCVMDPEDPTKVLLDIK